MANINYDDFINNIQPDPANPTATIMLSGFIGHGPEGHLRIYPDPSLGSWYDVPEADVVHSTAIPDAKLGGSYLWVKSSAQIKPGSTSGGTQTGAQGGGAAGGAAQAGVAAAAFGPTKDPPGCFTAQTPACCNLAAQAAAAPAAAMWPTPATRCHFCPPPTLECGQAAAAVQPTPALTIATVCTLPAHCAPTPATRCFICPPITHNCTPPAVCQPTPATHCFICPPITHNCTPATVCTHPHFGCPPPPLTQPVVCGILPPSVGCPQGAQPQAAAAASLPQCVQAAQVVQPTPTATTHCFICPPHSLPPACGLTAVVICTPQDVCQQPTPATHCFVCPPVTHNCTPATVCTQPPACQQHTVHNSLCICPTPSAVHQCGPQAAAAAAPTFHWCTWIGCGPTTACAPGRTGVFNPFGG
jgi:hypothetical protein